MEASFLEEEEEILNVSNIEASFLLDETDSFERESSVTLEASFIDCDENMEASFVVNQATVSASTPKKQNVQQPTSYLVNGPSSSNTESIRPLAEKASSVNIATPCCANECNKRLSLVDMEFCLEKIQDLNNVEQKQLILDILHDSSTITWDRNTPKATTNLVICGKKVCQSMFCRSYRISGSKFYACRKLYLEGVRSVVHGNNGKFVQTEKTALAQAWLTDYIERIGESMPHIKEIHLPIWMTKTLLYKRMKEEFVSRGYSSRKIITKGYFFEMWRTKFRDVKIPKASEFTVCGMCQSIKSLQEKASNRFDRAECERLREVHINHVKTEREQYHLARRRAVQEPSELTVMIIDGMDQSKTDIPHFSQKDKDTKHLAKLHVHLTGVLLHTKVPNDKLAYGYTDVKHIPHDPNLTIHCIMHTLEKNVEKLGKDLFIQLDNCWRENKNKYVISICSLLVQYNVFRQVTLHFLPVGHTHEDIDQMFSCVAKVLRRQNAYTYTEFCKVVAASYTPPIQMEEVTYVLNVKEWMSPHLAGAFGQHSKPLWFQFLKSEEKCLMRYKMWHNDPWEPREAGGLECFKSTPDVSVIPEWVVPCMDRTDIPFLMRDIPHKYGGRLPYNSYQNWKEYLESVKRLGTVPPTPTEWSFMHLVNTLDTREDTAEAPELEGLPGIRERIEITCPVITIGCQGKSASVSGTIEEVSDSSSVRIGMLAAVNLDDSTARPYIGEIVNTQDNDVDIHWFRGSYSGEWRPWNCGSGRNVMPYTSKVVTESLILWGFHLTPGKKLPQKIVNNLKDEYAKIDEHM